MMAAMCLCMSKISVSQYGLLVHSLQIGMVRLGLAWAWCKLLVYAIECFMVVTTAIVT